MSVATTMTRLHELALALPRPGCDWEDRPRFEPPATPQSVVELERMAGFALPGDLREFLDQTDSIVAMSVHNGYWLGGINRLIDGDSLPRVANGEAAIPVATDGGGNAFLLGASGRVWRWNHETDRMNLVAASFGAFLERVAADWSAYVSEKPGWQFLV
jgi:cell wall assembly regulator SMI1